MSTLVAQTISNGTVSTSSANVIQGSAKAWASFSNSSGTITILNSFNVSSITYLSTGTMRVSFTIAMPNTTYVLVGVAVTVGSAAGSLFIKRSTATTTSADFETVNTSAGSPLANLTENDLVIFSS